MGRRSEESIVYILTGGGTVGESHPLPPGPPGPSRLTLGTSELPRSYNGHSTWDCFDYLFHVNAVDVRAAKESKSALRSRRFLRTLKVC